MSNHHHRQIFSMGSCPPGPCASITKNTRQYTTDPQHTNSFVAINLRRHSLCQSWGIWISLVDKDSLLVGSVQPNAFQGVSQWTYCTQTAPETSVMWNSSFGSDLWQTYFSSLPYHQANTSELIPGDKILSINGYPISAFRNFEHITAYLRECLQLFLVVIRNNTAAARNALSTGVDITKRAILEDVSLSVL